MIFNNILQTIGHTPIVKLNHVSQDLACKLYAKCEFFNPGGSAKDRAAYQMVCDAEASGRIKPGDTLIEPSSGNTGIGLAMIGAVKGYKIIIILSAKVSYEKQVILEALGATVYRAPPNVAWNDPQSNIMMSKRLQQETPDSHILDQYTNPSNSKAHYENTAKEILEDFGNELKMVVMGVGTGGTITGVAKRLREKNPSVKIIGVDPNGSILGGGCHKDFYVEGIGYDFFPDVLDSSVIDEYIKVDDKDSFLMARRLIREEGLLVGGSSGSAACAALQAAKTLTPKDSCLVILPDTAHNYLSKFVDDRWMEKYGFLDHVIA